jgi:hypothetical protein
MSKYSGLFAVALGTLVLGSTLVVSACGSAPPLPAYAMPPSNDVKTLTFFLSQPRPGDKIIESAEEAIQSALIRAEYKITTDESEPHDGVIELEISASEKPATFVTFELNGQKQKDYAVHVSLSVKEGSSIVDQKVYEYTASEEDRREVRAAAEGLRRGDRGRRKHEANRDGEADRDDAACADEHHASGRPGHAGEHQHVGIGGRRRVRQGRRRAGSARGTRNGHAAPERDGERTQAGRRYSALLKNRPCPPEASKRRRDVGTGRRTVDGKTDPYPRRSRITHPADVPT